MAKSNELATKSSTELQVVPTPEDLTAIMSELQDMGTLPFGRVQIAAAGAGVFKVIDPGEDESKVATEIVGVIILSHRTNVLWLNKFGTVEDKTPDCLSLDGVEGIDRETGEIKLCDKCPHNQYGSADGGSGRGKSCKNTRRLYLMRPADGDRPSDVLPLILTLPSTSLTTFDKYRTKVMLSRRKMHGILTKITLKSAANKDGVEYSTPIFEVIGVLSEGETLRVQEYASGFDKAMRGAVQEDPRAGSVSASTNTHAPASAPAAAAPSHANAPVDDEDELPFG